VETGFKKFSPEWYHPGLNLLLTAIQLSSQRRLAAHHWGWAIAASLLLKDANQIISEQEDNG